MSRLTIAIDAALAAGDILRRKLNGARSITQKGPRDVVTDADVAAQHAILDRLRAHYPDEAILSEEGRHDADLSAPGPTWVIDPLDGTNNYARRFPLFGVSIGLTAGGEAQIGVIYDPLRRELFYAERGQGAFLRAGRGGPQRLMVSAVGQVADAFLVGGWPRQDALRAEAAWLTPRLGAVCHTLRFSGSLALNLAYLAAGRLDGGFSLAHQPWDVAAGATLVLEAGGQLSALGGGAWQLTSPQLLYSNGRLHAELRHLITHDPHAGG